MFKLVIQDDEGKTTVVPLIRDEITIGRKEGNTIRLTERNVSRRHARILRNNGEVHIEDLGSYNGIRVNNARIAERVSLRVSDQVQIGDYKLYLKAEGHEQVDDARTVPLERVDNAPHPIETMTSVTPVAPAPHPIHQAPTAPQVVGNPARTMVQISDTDPTQRSIGPATAAAVAALTATGGYGKLVVLSSNFAGKEFELSRPQMIIGRTDENDIVINHRSISRNHAKLVREPETGRYTISDLQSSNGVRVNGQDYGKVELRRGDVVDLGHVRLRFVEAGEDFVFARDAVITDVPETGGRRGLIVAILAAIVVVVAGIVLYVMHGKPKDEVVAPRAGTNSEVPLDAGENAVVTNDHPDRPGSDIVVDAAPATTVVATAGKPDDEKTQRQKCAQLKSEKKWQELDDCSRGLEQLGLKDEAGKLQAMAKQETKNEAKADTFRKAIHDGNLKAAQATLKEIGEDSVYYVQLRDTFTKAEAPVFNDYKGRAERLAAAHNCTDLNKLKQQASATTSERVASMVLAVKCDKPAPVDPGLTRPPPGPGSGSATQTVVTTPKANPCDTMDVDDAMKQAANQFGAGFAKAALQLTVKALACRQNERMYRIATMYACASHDLTSAKAYYNKVSPSFQPSLEQKCQEENTCPSGCLTH
jgi:pSer/pThr/pTyr-binding forkhead associated (FHA) protein